MKPADIIKKLLEDKRPEAKVVLNWIRRGAQGPEMKAELQKQKK